MSGKSGIAPCGHPGEHIIGNYVQCGQGCDRRKAGAIVFSRFNKEDAIRSADFFEDEPTRELCPFCGSDDIAPSVQTGFWTTPRFCRGCMRTVD